jgi:hypothetical protein
MIVVRVMLVVMTVRMVVVVMVVSMSSGSCRTRW